MKRFTILACAILFAILSPLSADEPSALPADLAAVPPSAIGFVHVRVSDLWKSELMKDLRANFLQAGPKALQAFEDRFYPPPSTIDRVTLLMLTPPSPAAAPPFVAIVAFSKPFDRDKAIKILLPHGKAFGLGAIGFVADEELELAIRIIDDHTLAVASAEAMKTFSSAKLTDQNPFASALREASRKHTTVFAANPTFLPGKATEDLPPALQPLTRAKVAQLTLDIGSRIQGNLRLLYGDEAQAQSAETAAREGFKMAGQALNEYRANFEKKLANPEHKAIWPIGELPEAALSVTGLGALNRAEEWLRDVPLSRENQSLALSIDLRVEPADLLVRIFGTSIAAMLGQLNSYGELGGHSRTANNLKQIILAFHNYHEAMNGFPASAICDKNGKPLLSWRVAILPYIEQANLYQQFHLDEPWDSENNKKLIPLMPKVYALPTVEAAEPGTTHFRAFYGNGAALDLDKPARIAQFQDGLSNTLLIAEAADFEYQPNKPLPKFGRPGEDGFWLGMADGSVHFVKKTISEKTLHALITRAGGEVIGPDFK
jgi:hypothetical protein